MRDENLLLHVKQDFPVLVNNPHLVYLDSGATALKPKCVIDKIDEYYNDYGVNVNRGVYQLSYQATAEYEETRALMAEFINAKESEIIYTKGASNGLNLICNGYGRYNLNKGDVVLSTELEHHSSVLPWQNLCQEIGAILDYVPLVNYHITVEAFKKKLEEIEASGKQVKIVALTHASNVMGYHTPAKEIISIAHEHNAIVILDAAQSIPHIKIDVKDLDCDFLAFSAHKMFGPTGFGIVYGKKKYLKKMKPIEFGGDMIDEVYKDYSTWKEVPYCFEAGTPPIAEAIAFKEAIKYINQLGYDNIRKHEMALMEYAKEKLSKIEGITVYNMDTDGAIISFNIGNIHSHDASTIFDEHHICLRSGHHCAQLITRLLGVPGTLRACFYVYNDYDDVDKFVDAIKEAAEYFKEW